ncbi:hypothetical protein [Streptomyces sp. CBMA123]|uniref:hypothetical protein n=1 Tax=Streptomyces sp. CBMA123 TaxID=1896313 RepID=UPI001661A848|nr:hypothetical protein [Streptomyces sp. CBMA123]
MIPRWSGESIQPSTAASVFLTPAPRFLTPHQPVLPHVLLLATAQALPVAAWLTAWTMVIGAATAALGSATLRTALGRRAGTVLVALGLRTAAAWP